MKKMFMFFLTVILAANTSMIKAGAEEKLTVTTVAEAVREIKSGQNVELRVIGEGGHVVWVTYPIAEGVTWFWYF